MFPENPDKSDPAPALRMNAVPGLNWALLEALIDERVLDDSYWRAGTERTPAV